MKRDLLVIEAFRIVRFAAVGMAATAVHLAVSLTLATGFGVPDQRANFLAFGTAFWFSFWGQYHWTFRSKASYRKTLPRFLLVAVAGYSASAMVIEGLLEINAISREIRLSVAALAVPTITYLLNRFIVFR